LNSIFGLAIIISAGFIGAKLLRRLHFPAVTAYLLIGILIGPRVLNVIPAKIVGFSSEISYFVLGVIAFSLGEHFTFSELKAAGRSVLWISIFEAAGAWLIVTFVIMIYCLATHMPLHPALVMGAAASATAPAATVMVVREYRARGIVTDMLLRVIAIDDAWCLILSALAITAASALHAGEFHAVLILHAFWEIIAAVVCGAALGFALRYMSRFARNQEDVYVLLLGIILTIVGVSLWFSLSPLLAAMAAGVVIANVSRKGTLYFDMLRNIDAVLFLCFFILVGANLEIDVIPHVGMLGVLYFGFRIIGKISGVKLGALISGSDPRIGRYLWWGLVPQAGVALGVALSAKALYPQYGEMIFTTIAATTVLYELLGPLSVKYGLRRAGEI
jgi:Kef-type K+ transport system membrane component KefB